MILKKRKEKVKNYRYDIKLFYSIFLKKINISYNKLIARLEYRQETIVK